MEANGLKIREARLTAGLSLRGLAREVGMHPANLCRLEQGKSGATIKTLTRLAKRLDLEIAEVAPEIRRLRALLNDRAA